jgi:hypothetical protein
MMCSKKRNVDTREKITTLPLLFRKARHVCFWLATNHTSIFLSVFMERTVFLKPQLPEHVRAFSGRMPSDLFASKTIQIANLRSPPYLFFIDDVHENVVPGVNGLSDRQIAGQPPVADTATKLQLIPRSVNVTDTAWNV